MEFVTNKDMALQALSCSSGDKKGNRSNSSRSEFPTQGNRVFVFMKTKELAMASLPGIFSQKRTHALKYLPASQDGDEHLDFTKIELFYTARGSEEKRKTSRAMCLYYIYIYTCI